MKKIISLCLVIMFAMLCSPISVSAAAYLWPVPGVTTVTQRYGNGHAGIDIAANGDHEIVAAREGTVIAAASTSCTHINNYPNACCNWGMGNYVQIKHSDGSYATYMHLRYNSVTVYVGQYVSRGTKIGMMGSSGNSSGQHLHFQVGYSSSNTINVNPDVLAYDFNIVSPPSAPTNCLAGSWDDRVQIQWDRVDNADYYECGLIEINTRELVVKADINDWYYNFYGVPEGQYFAYVCAHNSAGTSSHSNWYRVDVNYTVPAAANIKLDTDKTTEENSIQISWDSVSNTKSYEYYVAEFPGGYAYTTNTKHGNTTNTNITFTDLKSGHYIMFIHAISPLGKWGPQSNWLTFDVYAKDYIPTKIVSHDNHIYALYDYEMSWSFARDLCTDLGGHLVTVTNQKENDIITDLIGYGNMDAYWLGASDYGRDEKYFAWVTDEEFSYSHWADGEPNSDGVDGTKEHFAEIRKSYGNKWNDVHNINKASKGFILEIETDDITPAATETFNGNTYMIFDKNTTWSEAEYYCEMLGGHLVSINNSQENEFLKEFLQNGERNWYYIGADRTNGSWKWIDGNKFSDITWADDADNWKGNYLMMYKFSKKCVGFNNAYFPENDICHIGFVCEIESEPIHPITLDLNSNAVTENMNLKSIVNANICNNSVSAINAEIIFAYSRSDGTLIKLNRQNISIPPKDTINIEDNTTCKITELEKNLADKVEVYVWDSLNSMKPLSKKAVSEFVYE